MEANDAASYVQELAGDEANIIFGAKYDENMIDEATITVIATGLEASARNTVPSMPGMMKYDQSAVRSTVTPNMASRTTINNGLHTSASANAGVAQQSGSTMGIQRPVQPESTVKPVEINIPDFLKNSKR